ncbi:MAG: hypothetical protein RL716_1082 [Actinomycetota bacterium]
MGLSIAIAAGLTKSTWMLVAIIALSFSVIIWAREKAPWSQSLKFYSALAAFVVITRIAFRIIFNYSDGPGLIIFSLPQIEIDIGLGTSVQFFGNVSALSLIGALTDGLRLAAIIVGIALANSLANPRKLLKSTPSALYEIASAISVAINLAPQLISSLHRVRRAGSLRGRSKGLSSLAGTVIPVLEDTIENSLSLAASMDARGFQGSMTKGEQTISRLASLGSLLAIIFGMFFLLSGTALALSVGLILLGLALIFVAMRLASKRSIRTRFQPRRLTRLDLALAVVSIALVTASSFGWWLN